MRSRNRTPDKLHHDGRGVRASLLGNQAELAISAAFMIVTFIVGQEIAYLVHPLAALTVAGIGCASLPLDYLP